MGHINSSVEHYISDKNHIPPWILVTNLSFGLSIKWYNILKSDDKSEICSQFISDNNISDSDKKEFLAVALSLLKEYRNRIAHSNRTFNTQGLPVLPKRQLLLLANGSLSSGEYNQNIGKSDLFAVILAFFILIDDRFILSNLIQDLSYVLRPYEENLINGKSIFEIFNLPNDIFFRMDKLLDFKFS